jgi:hypothetical protein
MLDAFGHVQASIRQVPNPWREAEAQQVRQCKHMIRKTRRVGVMLFDPKIGFMVQQSIEHVCRVANGGIYYQSVKRRVLVGHMGVKEDSRIAATVGVDLTRSFTTAHPPENIDRQRKM